MEPEMHYGGQSCGYAELCKTLVGNNKQNGHKQRPQPPLESFALDRKATLLCLTLTFILYAVYPFDLNKHKCMN